jgi:hypothetical protein
MSAILLLSFDEMDAASDVGYFYPYASSVYDVVIDASVPSGFTGNSLRVDPGGYGTSYVGVSFPENQAGKTLNIGCHMKITGVGAVLSLHSVSSDGAARDQQIALSRNSNGFLEVKRGTTVIATGATYIGQSDFNFYQISTRIDNEGSFVVRLNGNPVPDIDFEGDTQNKSSNDVRQICFGSDALNNTPTTYFYQPIVFNSDGTTNNGLVPVKLVHAHRHPVSDGAEIWTPNSGSFAYTRIDEVIGAPDDADYVKTSTLNAKNRCLVGGAVSNVGEVAAVQVLSRYKKPTVGAVAVKSGVIAGANEVQSVARYLPSGLSNYNDVFEYKTGTTKFAAGDITGGTLEVTAQVSAIT